MGVSSARGPRFPIAAVGEKGKSLSIGGVLASLITAALRDSVNGIEQSRINHMADIPRARARV